MPRTRTMLTALLAALFLTAPLSAYEPSWYIGSYGFVEGYSEANEPYAGAALSGIVNWRTYNEHGFLALSGSAEVSRYIVGSQAFRDRFTLGLEAGSSAGDLQFKGEADGVFALNHAVYGRYAAPSWSFRLSPADDNADGLTPAFEYFGSYSYQETDVGDTLAQGAAAELSYDPSVTRGYGLRLSGAWELRPDQNVLDSAGDPTSTRRRDLTASAELSAEGMLGYFTDWETSVSAGLRRSNANSQDRLTAGYEGQLSWSPTRRISLSSRLFGEGEWYTERQPLLRVYSAGGSLSNDINLSEQLYAVLSLSGSRTFSSEPGFEGWNFSIRGGLEFSL